jgi:hypothetical protein
MLASEELRALQAVPDVSGGYLVAPEQFVTELIKKVDDQVAIRGLITERADRAAQPAVRRPTCDRASVACRSAHGEDSRGTETSCLRRLAVLFAFELAWRSKCIDLDQLSAQGLGVYFDNVAGASERPCALVH